MFMQSIIVENRICWNKILNLGRMLIYADYDLHKIIEIV
jgi:hypothetical protein